ncbi:MAG: hypothetical protein QOJ38_554 [Solirubrobacterales bacterium]|jgi:O-antigen/teichoic acid export membrane protein|nr:hypothetical protein [Solirubrobacterales bacterium]
MLPADFGISQSTARFIAERRDAPAEAAAVLAAGLRLKLISAGALAAGLFALAGPIADAYNVQGLVWPLRGMALALFAQSLLMLYSGAFVALGRISLNLGAVASESAVELASSVTLVLLGAGATGAAFGRAAGYLVGAGVAIGLVVRLLGRGALTDAERGPERRRIARYAGALFVIDGAFTVLGQIDVLLIGAFLSTSAVGLFQAPWRLASVLHYPGLALAAGVAPRLAADPGGGREPDVGAFAAALRLMIVVQAALVVPLLVWAEPIARLALGPAFADSAEVIRALAPYVLLAGLAPLVSNGVDYLGQARRRIPIAVATLAVNVAVDAVLIPRIGIVAGAIGSSAGYLVYVPGHLWLCDRLLGLPMRSLALTLGRTALAAAAMAAAMLTVGTAGLSAVDWLLGSAGGLAAFVIVLAVTGEAAAVTAGVRRLRR